MNKIMYIFSLFLFLGVIFTQGDDVNAMTEEEIVVHKQAQLLSKFEKELAKLEIKVEELNQVGDFYFENEKIVLQLDKNNQDKKRLEKLEKIASKMKSDTTIITEIEEVSNSFNELTLIQNNIMNKSSSIGLKDYLTYVDSKSNKIILIARSISTTEKEILESSFGNNIKIEIDENIKENYKSEPEATKSRTDNWNSLGAGIGIRIYGGGSYGTCSTAGIAQKGSSLWVMSAGHCNDIGDNIYQFSTNLGSTHLDATSSDFDFLLIKADNSYIDRFASNGLYSSFGDTSSGYDEALEGDFVEKTGLRVCKVGISTGRTCGEISRLGLRRDWFGSGILITEVRKDGTLLSKEGDSGGAWFTQSQPYRLVGIHQGGNKNLADNGSSVSYFTPWYIVRDRYDLNLYTSSTKVPMN